MESIREGYEMINEGIPSETTVTRGNANMTIESTIDHEYSIISEVQANSGEPGPLYSEVSAKGTFTDENTGKNRPDSDAEREESEIPLYSEVKKKKKKPGKKLVDPDNLIDDEALLSNSEIGVECFTSIPSPPPPPPHTSEINK